MGITLDATLIGKPVTELTPAELAALASQLAEITTAVDTRRAEIKDKLEGEQKIILAKAGKEFALALAWAKLPHLMLKPNIDGTEYTVEYIAKKKGKNGGKRAPVEVNSGKLTITKISEVFGGIAFFTNKKTGDVFETMKELIVGDTVNKKPGLVRAEDGTSESSHCHGIASSGGIAASDILTHYHGEDVALTFQDGREMTVKEAVDALKAARAAA